MAIREWIVRHKLKNSILLPSIKDNQQYSEAQKRKMMNCDHSLYIFPGLPGDVLCCSECNFTMLLPDPPQDLLEALEVKNLDKYAEKSFKCPK